MRPIKIILTAFGPYKQKEVIDFRDLNEHRLFVISGNTGAGKTSIFDAICFALYGEASGEDRNDARMLRSHFAADDDHTSVDFEFELRGRTYRVFRQLAHIKGTNKTATGDKYELYELTGDQETLLVDRLTVSQVNEKLQQIIGLTKDQFSQIVMLPQGEFRKLLTSETEDKEEILRKIFKTGLFKQMTEKLNENRVSSQKVYEEQKQERDLHIKSIKQNLPNRIESHFSEVIEQENYNTHQVLEALGHEMHYYQQETEQQKKHFTEQNKQLQEKTTQFHNAKTINERFDHLDMKREQKEALKNKRPAIDKKEQQLKLAELASKLEVHEEHYNELDQEVKEMDIQLENANLEHIRSVEKIKTAKEVFKKEEEKHKQREQATILVNKLKEWVPKVVQLDEKGLALNSMKVAVERLMQQNQNLTIKISDQKAEKLKIVKVIKRLENNNQGYTNKVDHLQEIKTQTKSVNDFLQLVEMQTKISTEMINEETKYVSIKKDYDTLEAHWIEGQASLLAEHLHAGEPCPVCGSAEHPERAVRQEDVPTKEILEQKRKVKEMAEATYRRLQSDLSSINSQIETKQLEVTDLKLPIDELGVTLHKLIEDEKQLEKELIQLKMEQKEIEQKKKENERLEKMIETTETERLQVEKQYNETVVAYEKATTSFEQLVNDIPESLQSLEMLRIEIKEKEEEKQKLEHQWKVVQEQLTEANERYFKAKSTVENFTKQLELTKDKKEKAYKKFNNELLAAGFLTEEEFRQAKLSKIKREAMKEEIQTYKTEVTTVQKQITELKTELIGKERYDLGALQKEIHQLEQILETLRLAYIENDNLVKLIDKGMRDIESANKKVKDSEQTYYIHKDLYDVVRGDNAKKISFERYLLIEFLEQIVQVANQRLTRLSNGQFQLVRSDRLEKRGKQSGLSLDVYDNYTGQKRDVKTLSGGEKFNASLSLALGMVDIIQSHQGGISIETMFIDEGFGSLDEESLSKAIDTLIELQQSGRLIGVISHVQELKQAIPAILDVRKTKEGHSQTAFVIK
ncbi:AAA family ATPase [Alkalihalobacterium alkalinitrilicum]|uniref:AAA family ATPase n=1 Tax=Alkalihalobacterium alkalinitrilicum TaxID=427920 RepID=UPI000994FAC8|nr:SMC family ATPase [Alkalihalobacterium alkalinitrilicum]